ncbi:hypothetical protein [Dyadobacter tibetensis]|uniref:hypothetical protein n=1 Tax=Dyadobacter tibetensis TaxID=1211851 RepID=UPI001038EFAA|nr:hypothetical protein [Dyadobacter tibetensis]
MKKFRIVSICIALILVCLFQVAWKVSDVLTDLNTSEMELRDRFFSNLKQKQFQLYGWSSNMKKAAQTLDPSRQTQAIDFLATWAKGYSASKDFKERYAAWLDKQYPQIDLKTLEGDIEEKYKRHLRNTQNMQPADFTPTLDILIQNGETFSGMEGMLSSLPPKDRVEMKKQIDDAKKEALFYKSLKPLLKSDFETFKAKYARHQAERDIESEKGRIETNNLENAQALSRLKDPNQLIKSRLLYFLENSKNIDFKAQTKLVNNRKKFINPSYEQKHEIWKFCYRMGPEPTEAARRNAQAWLNSLK